MDSKYLDLIIKDLNGELSPDEKKVLWNWLPQNREFYNEVKNLWDSMDEKAPDFPYEKKWEELKLRIEGEQNKKSTYWGIWGKLAVAASISILIIASVLFFRDSKEPLAIVQETPGNHEADKSIEIFYLPDSSIVWLNKNSSIRISDDFNKNERLIDLIGEAFFLVKPDKSKPFLVNSSNTTTKVVGTSFNIEAYPGNNVTISVESGAVEFYNKEHPATKLFLWASDKAICDERGGMELISGKESQNMINHLEESGYDWRNNKNLIKKDQLALAEVSNPEGYIHHEFALKKNMMNQALVEGKLFNSAIFTSYKDIKIRVAYYTEDKKRVGVEYFDLPRNLLPGTSVEYKFKLQDWFEGADILDVDVEKANNLE